MFICLPCAQRLKLFSAHESYGPCELCDGVDRCYSIPAHKVPIEAVIAARGRGGNGGNPQRAGKT